MAKIFISYRREDAQWPAHKLYDTIRPLVADPETDVFIDVDNIPLGVNFSQHLDGKVAQCDYLLAVIGPHWLSVTNPETGQRRLDDPGDFVRIEIASALARGIPVIPVLMDGAKLPAPLDLPEDLRELPLRNGVEVRHLSFEHDVERLLAGLGLADREQVKVPRESLAKLSAGAAKVRGTLDAPKASRSTQAQTQVGKAPVYAFAALVTAVAIGAVAYFTDPFGSFGDDVVQMAEAEPPPAAAQVENEVGSTFRDCPDCPEMVVLPSGSFTMGSPADEEWRDDDEGPQRTVRIGYSFAVGKYEVTWAEWEVCVSAGGCDGSGPQGAGDDNGWGKGNRPVFFVSWNDAKDYAAWLSRKTGESYRLLSEAEWEYAARAGTTTPFSFGATISTNQANYNGKHKYGSGSYGQYRERTTSVGTFPANPFGLHDMHGNVWEWVEDCYQNSYSGAPSDGGTRTTGSCSFRVLRGGSWNYDPSNLRSAARHRNGPTNRSINVGFRVARTLPR